MATTEDGKQLQSSLLGGGALQAPSEAGSIYGHVSPTTVGVGTPGHGESFEAIYESIQQRGERVLLTGNFSPDFITYSLWLFVLAMTAAFCGIPVAVLFIPCVHFGLKARYASMKVILTDKSIMYTSGAYSCCCTCWSESERIVPLEKITDCTWKQGCLQRYFGVDQLDIRTAAGNMTAGDGHAGGADISLTGLVQSKDFRTALMKAKDERDHFLATGVIVSDGTEGVAAAPMAVARGLSGAGREYPAVVAGAESAQTLTSINDSLLAIKELLFKKADTVRVEVDDSLLPQ